MNSTNEFVCVLITAPEIDTARHLAKTILDERLVACVNIVPKIESHYWWQEEIQLESECLLICKTTQERFESLQSTVLSAHPYETPEIVAIPIVHGLETYLDWVRTSVSTPPTEMQPENGPNP